MSNPPSRAMSLKEAKEFRKAFEECTNWTHENGLYQGSANGWTFWMGEGKDNGRMRYAGAAGHESGLMLELPEKVASHLVPLAKKKFLRTS